MDCSLPSSSVHGILQNTGVSFPTPEYLPDLGIEPGPPALQADSLPTELGGKPSSLSRSIIFLYFFALFIEEGLLTSYLSLLFSGILYSVGYIFTFLPCFLLFYFPQLCKASSDNHCAFLYFFFFLMALVTASCTMLPTSVHCSSGTLPTRSNALNLFITSSGQS